MRPSIAAFATTLCLIATGAQAADAAASLGAVQGQVLVSAQGKLGPARNGAALRPGDRVIARSGAAALTYADGCVVSLAANGMATVADRSPCAGGPGLITNAQGSAAAVSVPRLPNWPAGAYFAGAGVAVIGGALIYGLTMKEDDPVSN